MCIAYYSTASEDAGRRVLGLIKNSSPDTRIKILRTLVGLLGSLKNFPSPRIALFVVADDKELASVLSLKKYLQNSRVILILPDRSEATLRLSSALSPLLICFRDGDFSEVGVLLARLEREKRAKMEEGDPKRYWWTGELPSISSLYPIDAVARNRYPEELPLLA